MTFSYGKKVVIIAMLTLLLGCGETNKDTSPTEGMTVFVDFRDVHRCSRISPEITIENAPQGTRYYDVSLMELGQRDKLLGGGEWFADGSGTIPEGVLTRYYRGPCPSTSQSREFAYVVKALGEDKTNPLSVRLFKVVLDD